MTKVAVKFAGYVWRPMTDSEADTDFVLELRNAPAAQAAFFTQSITREGHLKFLKAAEARGEMNWVIEREGERVGVSGLYHIDEANRRAEAGRVATTVPEIYVFNNFVTALVIFDVLKFHKMYGETVSTNSPANKSLERMGAKREGVLREHVFKDGQPVDVYAYGMLPPEWEGFRERMTKLHGPAEVMKHAAEEDVW